MRMGVCVCSPMCVCMCVCYTGMCVFVSVHPTACASQCRSHVAIHYFCVVYMYTETISYMYVASLVVAF